MQTSGKTDKVAKYNTSGVLGIGNIEHHVTIIGAGPAGLTAALAVSCLRLPVTLVAPQAAPEAGSDRRTAALFTGSISLLQNLGLWAALEPKCTPIRAIRIIDDTGGLLRAPQVEFTAQEVGLEQFGYNVPNAALTGVLAEAVQNAPLVSRRHSAVKHITIEPSKTCVELTEGGEVEGALIIGADGRASPSRQAAGIPARSWSYPQSAIVTTFAHSRAHNGISTEFLRSAGPLTTVPLGGNRSSLVWVDRPEEAQRLVAADPSSFLSELEDRLQGLLGSLHDLGPRSIFPLSGLSAEAAGRNRVALVGESSHVIPPIGAQGLNLGLRDVAALADCLADAVTTGQNISSDRTLSNYSKARAPDINTRVTGIDLLNRSLISELLPASLARGWGLHLLKSIGPLRRRVVREGLQPSFALPLLMQPGGRQMLEARLAQLSAACTRAGA